VLVVSGLFGAVVDWELSGRVAGWANAPAGAPSTSIASST
jgi:hypothetical protein